MILPDINVLIYAFNDGTPEHDQAKQWWEELMNGTTPVALPWLVSSGFIRLVTHPKILNHPMSVPDAVKIVRSWLNQPVSLVIEPGKRFPDLFFHYLQNLGTAGSLTTDAQLAALAVEHQAELHSSDNDFSRFEGLRWRNPLR